MSFNKNAFDIVEQTFEKIAKDRDNDTETRFFRDRVFPEMGRNLTSGAVGAAVTAPLIPGVMKDQKKMINSMVNGKQIDPELLKRVGSLGKHPLAKAGAIAGLGTSLYLRNKKLKELNNEYLDGQEPTNIDRAKALSSTVIGQRVPFANLVSTPEAVVQKKRRELL